MATDLPPTTIADFIIGDFEDAWEGLATRHGNLHRGNFLFARQAMTLLEFACRLCHSDASGQVLRDFSVELASRDPRYFTELPGSCWTPRAPVEFRLPSQGPTPEREFLAALFDLIRNGQAHQYQQIRVQLNDGKGFSFSLTGADCGRALSQTFANGRPPDHLKAWLEPNGDIWMKVRPDVLFMDVKDSVRATGLLSRGLTLTYLSRPAGSSSLHYRFSSTDMEARLRSGGHL